MQPFSPVQVSWRAYARHWPYVANPKDDPIQKEIKSVVGLGSLTVTELDREALQFLYGKPGTNFEGVESKLGFDFLFIKRFKERVSIDENHDINIPVFGVNIDSHPKAKFRLTPEQDDLLADNKRFEFDEKTGDVFFRNTPDFENPMDEAGSKLFVKNNIYQLEVQYMPTGLGETIYDWTTFGHYIIDVIDVIDEPPEIL